MSCRKHTPWSRHQFAVIVRRSLDRLPDGAIFLAVPAARSVKHRIWNAARSTLQHATLERSPGLVYPVYTFRKGEHRADPSIQERQFAGGAYSQGIGHRRGIAG